MQTVASLAKRLDMSPEEAVDKLRFMLFEVEGVDSIISDEECDLLIDVDDDESVALRVREEKEKAAEKERKRNERLRQAAKKAAAKRKADAKKKATAKKPSAKKKAAAKKPSAKKKSTAEGAVATEPEAEEAAAEEALLEISVVEEILEEPEVEEGPVEAAPVEEHAPPKAEILPPRPEPEEEPEAHPEPSITIGRAIEHDAHTVQILRADGTPVDVPEMEVAEAGEPEPEEEETQGLVAEAERYEEEEELRTPKSAPRSSITPDPAVVAEVKRRAAERMQKLRGGAHRTVGGEAPRKVIPGKTARKRQKKAEKARAEEARRRDAAAAVREFQAGGPAGARKRKRRRTREEEQADQDMAHPAHPAVIEVEESLSVEDLAAQMGVEVTDVILELMDHNIMATKNQTLDIETIRKIAEHREIEVRSVIPEEDEVLAEEPDDEADLQPRAPVITVMGHVDHGKTTFLDHVRSANVAEGEAGGITQHIAAYDVPVGDGRVVFLDTPGHEAFTQMRARGAQATDVVVLVVAADDGVMPQTIEAIDHAKAAEVPIVVAVNKCDKPNAQPDRIRQELTKYELVSEEWGGQTIIKNISAKSGDGVDELMELLLLESELLELKANPNKRARGVVIESEILLGQGPVAWVLVQSGTLQAGDVYIAGTTFGRVRAMTNSRGATIQEAPPSTPVLVTGFSEPPDAGDEFIVVPEERVARAIANKRADLARQKQGRAARRITLEDFHEALLAGERQELNVVIKADVQGSVDVLESSLSRLGNEEVRIRVVHSAVGAINESDVLLASASDAVIIGFHVTGNQRSQKLAEREGVDIRTYRVIYEAIDDVRKALEGMLAPDSKEVITGHAEIRQVFRSSAVGNIAGSYVTDGEIARGSLMRLVRDGTVIQESKVATLRREKDDARTVQSGFECGIKIDGFEDIKVGDVVETYRVESVAKTLA